MLARLAVLQSAAVRIEPLRRRAIGLWTNVRGNVGPALRRARVVSKRAIVIALAPLEAILLSAPTRERIQAGATFALILAFAVSSVDFLLSGGPELNAPGRTATQVAYASPISPVVRRDAETAVAENGVIAPETIIAPAPRARVVPTAYTVEPDLIAPMTEPQGKTHETPATEAEAEAPKKA